MSRSVNFRTGNAESQRTIAFHVAGFPGNGLGLVLPPLRRLGLAICGADDNPLCAALSKIAASFAQRRLVQHLLNLVIRPSRLLVVPKVLGPRRHAAAPPSPNPIKTALRLVIAAYLDAVRAAAVTRPCSARRIQ